MASSQSAVEGHPCEGDLHIGAADRTALKCSCGTATFVRVASDLGTLQRCGAQHIAEYCDQSSSFAWPAYDIDLTPGRFAPVELLAPALLSYPLSGKKIVQPMLADNDSDYRLLYRAIESTVETQFKQPAQFDELDATHITEGTGPPPWQEFWKAWTLADRCAHITSVGLTKMLHRKAPDLVPIMDSRVRAFFGCERGARASVDAMLAIRANLDAHRDLVMSWCGVAEADKPQLKPLRAIDIAEWMHMGECEYR